MYLIYKLICSKPDHFLLAQTVLLDSFKQIYILLGMYNFGGKTEEDKSLLV